MSIDDEGARLSAAEEREVKRPAATATVEDRGRSRTGPVLGSLLTLLVLAGAVYYFGAHRAGTDVATGPNPAPATESPTPAPQQSSPASAEKPVASTASPEPTSPQATPPQPTSPLSSTETAAPQQSPTAPPPQPATAAEKTPKAPPVTTAQDATGNAPAKTNESAAAQTAQSGSQPGANAPALAQPPQSMRDQPAALPDQPAAAPKNEVTLVVKRGPANIRSTPSKSGRVIGTVTKDAQVKEISRSGSWVEVETESGRGWISSGLTAPL
jgi:hypothetical protein